MESFWGTLKQELVHHRRYSARQEAIREITEYIEVFYNRQRRQARLGYLSPAVYEQKFYAGQLAAWMLWCPLLTSDLKMLIPGCSASSTNALFSSGLQRLRLWTEVKTSTGLIRLLLLVIGIILHLFLQLILVRTCVRFKRGLLQWQQILDMSFIFSTSSRANFR